MFVRGSVHRKLEADHYVLIYAYKELQRKWDDLVDTINAKGGRQFLDEAQMGNPSPLTPEDIQRLLQLCHPDKHGGKPLAVDMTQRLLEIRDKAT